MTHGLYMMIWQYLFDMTQRGDEEAKKILNMLEDEQE